VRRLLIISAVAALAGCTVGPDYSQPAPDTVPAEWSAAPAGSDADPTAKLALWWERFGDPQLTALVQRAVRGNLDLRVPEARALHGIRAAQLWPRFDTGGRLSPAAGNTQAVSLAALDAIWEIDVFGGVHRSVEAADADTDVSVEARRAVLFDLTGAVAAT
jgi:outer membrane protein TolC